MKLVSWITPRSRLSWATPLSANLSPPLWPFCMLYDPNQIGIRVFSPPSPLSPLLVAVPVLLHIPYQWWYFIRGLPPLSLPDPARAVPSYLPSPLSRPARSSLTQLWSHFLLPLPLMCCSFRHVVLHSALVTGQVARCSGYRGRYPREHDR